MSAASLQRQFIRIRNNKLFEAFVIPVIVFIAIMIGAKTYQIDRTFTQAFEILDFGITLFFFRLQVIILLWPVYLLQAALISANADLINKPSFLFLHFIHKLFCMFLLNFLKNLSVFRSSQEFFLFFIQFYFFLWQRGFSVPQSFFASLADNPDTGYFHGD